MENKLAENIRTFRKQRALTQEQLAEVLGVTVGAVYKWEARLSQPELSTIMELADFFDTSVDVLLGYELKDNRLRTTAARLKKYQSDKDEAGLAEAEKALKKYPNSFEIVFNAAGLFSVFGTERGEKRLMRRALELLEKSRQLIAQNLSTLTNDAASIETNYLAQMLAMITKAVTFIGALLLMCRYSLLMTAIAAGLTVLPLIASLLTGNRLQAVESRVSERNGEFTAALSDCLAGFTVVKNFKAEREIFRLFAQSNKALEREKFTGRRIKTLVGMIGAVTGIFAQLGVFIAGVYLSMKGGSMTPGAVVLFVNLMNFIISPIAELPGLLACRKAALGLVDKLAAALERSSSREGSETLNRLENGIRLENVSFAYEPGKTVLHGINAEFEAGRAYALVGGSGSGKSTLLNLLMAAETNYSGHILADGIELSDISTESLYGTMAAIQQNVFVFNASIKDNVSMFRDFPKTEMDEAIARAHLGALIRERGEDYLCGENGSVLSGGEKQRISVARSLLKKSSVLLADEVTAALDAQTAHRVSSDILDLQGITRIVVMHTLEESLLRRYDKIFVLRGGRIEEAGSFADLMANKGYFYALFTVAQ